MEFDQLLDSGAMASEVKKDFSDGQKLGVSGTPAFFINGIEVIGAQPFSVFEQVIEGELAK
jgi:protein-disulfide isomerase